MLATPSSPEPGKRPAVALLANALARVTDALCSLLLHAEPSAPSPVRRTCGSNGDRTLPGSRVTDAHARR